MRVTNLTAAKPGTWPRVRHAACKTEIEFRNIMNERTQQREGTVWCGTCARACEPDELDPPGAVCLVFD